MDASSFTPGDIVRVWSAAGFVFAMRPLEIRDTTRATVTVSRKETIKAGTLALYIGPNAKESKRLGQPMVNIVVGEKNYSIDRRFLDVVLV
jgi:hypothetical protein